LGERESEHVFRRPATALREKTSKKPAGEIRRRLLRGFPASVSGLVLRLFRVSSNFCSNVKKGGANTARTDRRDHAAENADAY
jgi:hypothetical protein